MGIQRRVLEYACRDTTHMDICDFLSSADETHIYNRIQGLIGNSHPRRMTSLGFFLLISKIFRRKYTKQLPQDLVPEIVSRLSAEDVLKCIMVCKGWMDVILNPYFFYLHESRAHPLILLQNIDQTNDTKLIRYLLCVWGSRIQFRMAIQRRVLEYACRDTTHMDICDFLSSADETHIYNRIQGLIGNSHPRRMTSLGFFLLISKIFRRKYTKQLPQDLVPEIVSRLSAKDVLKCIMVCKGWMDVILNPYFFNLHESRAHPLILLQNIDQTNDTKLWSLDLTHEKPYIRRFDTTKLMANVNYYLVGTIDGLLVLQTHYGCSRRSSLLSICNPLTGRVIKGVTIDGDCCFGFWFHPLKRDYLFLTACSLDLYTDRGCCYKIFNLKGESAVAGWYGAKPTHDVPIIIGNTFYYLCKKNRIMSFDTETEEFDLKVHPHYTGCNGQEMRLLEIEGSLAFSHVSEGMKSLFL